MVEKENYSKGVNLYFWGERCLWNTFMIEQGREVAEKLKLPFKGIDIGLNPEEAEKNKIYFPGIIEINGFKMAYPGKARELLVSYRKKGPLPGEMVTKKLPVGAPERVETISGKVKKVAGFCGLENGMKNIDKKEKELEENIPWGLNASGFIAFNGKEPVGVVEFILESRCPYPLPAKRDKNLFVTCIYGSSKEGIDYRKYLIKHLVLKARERGYQGLSVIAGEETPYPNGPMEFFQEEGFESRVFLGRFLLRNKWEKIYFMEKNFC